MNAASSFPAKVLLFGEYIILQGATALALPFPTLSAQWRMGSPEREECRQLISFLAFLLDKQLNGLISIHGDIERLIGECRQGLYLASNIPSGGGLGSSGAVVAAVYERLRQGIPENAPGDLRPVLAAMENYFHGSSSGIDPLVSLTRSPVLFANHSCQKAEVPARSLNHIYLVDSGLPRRTADWVEQMKLKWSEPGFLERTRNTWMPANESAISSCLAGDLTALETQWEQLSAFQQEHLPGWFPEHIRNAALLLQKRGLAWTKLCGAGGGGYFLTWVREPRDVETISRDYQWKLMPVSGK